MCDYRCIVRIDLAKTTQKSEPGGGIAQFPAFLLKAVAAEAIGAQ